MHQVIRFLIVLIFGIILPLMVAIIITDTFYLDLSWMILIWIIAVVVSLYILRKFDRSRSSRN